MDRSPNSHGSECTNQKKRALQLQRLSSLIEEIRFGGMGGVFILSFHRRKEEQVWTWNGTLFRCQQWDRICFAGLWPLSAEISWSLRRVFVRIPTDLVKWALS